MFDQLSSASVGNFAVGGLLIGLLAATWRHVRSFASRLMYLLVCRADIVDRQTSAGVWNELVTRGRVLSGGRRLISAKSVTDRRNGRTVRLVGDLLNGETKFVWYRNRPVMVSRKNIHDSSGNAGLVPVDQNESTYMTLSWIRWTLDFDGLLLLATASWRGVDCVVKHGWSHATRGDGAIVNIRCSSARPLVPEVRGRGYFTVSHAGTVGRSSIGAVQGSAGSLPDRSMTVSEPTGDLSMTDFTPLGFDRAHIGEAAPKNPVGCFAMTETLRAAFDDCRTWLASRDFCEERGLAWRRGYLFWGQPGSGKSTAVRLLAQTYALPVHRIFLGTMRTSEFLEAWERVLADGPCIALIEDIDAVFDGRKNVIDASEGVSFDVLLNEISGVKLASGVLLVVTTNDRTKIDEALGVPVDLDHPVSRTTRPGRLDRAFQLPKPSPIERAELAHKLLDGLVSVERIDELALSSDFKTMTEFHQEVCRIAGEAYWNLTIQEPGG